MGPPGPGTSRPDFPTWRPPAQADDGRRPAEGAARTLAAAWRGSSATNRLWRWMTGSAAEFQEALLDADSFDDLPGKWQAAILEAEQNRRKLRVVTGD